MGRIRGSLLGTGGLPGLNSHYRGGYCRRDRTWAEDGSSSLKGLPPGSNTVGTRSKQRSWRGCVQREMTPEVAQLPSCWLITLVQVEMTIVEGRFWSFQKGGVYFIRGKAPGWQWWPGRGVPFPPIQMLLITLKRVNSDSISMEFDLLVVEIMFCRFFCFFLFGELIKMKGSRVSLKVTNAC